MVGAGMIFKPTSKQELIGAIATIIMNTPEEFIDFDEVEFDIGSEFSVDGSDEEEWSEGCRVRLHKTGQMIFIIPLKRKASVYAYYADQMDGDIEEAQSQVEDLKRKKEIYGDIGRSE